MILNEEIDSKNNLYKFYFQIGISYFTAFHHIFLLGQKIAQYQLYPKLYVEKDWAIVLEFDNKDDFLKFKLIKGEIVNDINPNGY